MQTLTYGIKVPESTDTGTEIFDALEDNLEQIDAHTHDGVDSPVLDRSAIVGEVATIASGSWVANGATGHYRQAITVPAGFDFDTVTITFRVTGATGPLIYPTVERISDTQYYVYTSDNTKSFYAVYGG